MADQFTPTVSEIVGWLQRRHPEWLETAVLGATADKLHAALVAERATDAAETPDGADTTEHPPAPPSGQQNRSQEAQ